jgi:hypothetical protein
MGSIHVDSVGDVVLNHHYGVCQNIQLSKHVYKETNTLTTGPRRSLAPTDVPGGGAAEWRQLEQQQAAGPYVHFKVGLLQDV